MKLTQVSKSLLFVIGANLALTPALSFAQISCPAVIDNSTDPGILAMTILGQKDLRAFISEIGIEGMDANSVIRAKTPAIAGAQGTTENLFEVRSSVSEKIWLFKGVYNSEKKTWEFEYAPSDQKISVQDQLIMLRTKEKSGEPVVRLANAMIEMQTLYTAVQKSGNIRSVEDLLRINLLFRNTSSKAKRLGSLLEIWSRYKKAIGSEIKVSEDILEKVITSKVFKSETGAILGEPGQATIKNFIAGKLGSSLTFQDGLDSAIHVVRLAEGRYGVTLRFFETAAESQVIADRLGQLYDLKNATVRQETVNGFRRLKIYEAQAVLTSDKVEKVEQRLGLLFNDLVSQQFSISKWSQIGIPHITYIFSMKDAVAKINSHVAEQLQKNNLKEESLTLDQRIQLIRDGYALYVQNLKQDTDSPVAKVTKDLSIANIASYMDLVFPNIPEAQKKELQARTLEDFHKLLDDLKI